jgi:hypothetical protein
VLDAVRETVAFGLLKERLSGLEAGEVAEVGPVAALLAGCWHDFAGEIAWHACKQAESHRGGAVGSDV